MRYRSIIARMARDGSAIPTTSTPGWLLRIEKWVIPILPNPTNAPFSIGPP